MNPLFLSIFLDAVKRASAPVGAAAMALFGRVAAGKRVVFTGTVTLVDSDPATPDPKVGVTLVASAKPDGTPEVAVTLHGESEGVAGLGAIR